MTAQEFKQARLALSYSVKQMAEALRFGGDGQRHVRRLESGECKITGPVEVCIGLMLMQKGMQ